MRGAALCCGINHFARPGHDLRGCVADAETMDSVLLGLGLSVNDIHVFTDNQVIKTNVMGALADMSARAARDKLTYVGFSYSAHGTHGNLPDGGLFEAICCYDIHSHNGDWDYGTLIEDRELKKALNAFPKTCLVEVWLDTCFSGGMDRIIMKPRSPGISSCAGQPKFLHNPGNAAGLMRVANSRVGEGLNANVVMWCACSAEQTSSDAYLGGTPHGAFTYFWDKAYKKNPQTSRVQLLVDTRVGLRANGFQQLPRLKAWNRAAQAPVGA